MEIRTNISAPVQARTVSQPSHASQPSALQQTPSDIQIQTPGMREFSNAMTILQTAGAIIQQALNAASRLHSAAQQAMTTGRVDTQEIANSIAEVKGAIQTQGQPQTITQPPLANRPAAPETLPADREISDMAKMAETGKIDRERLAEITKSLEEKSRANSARIDETAARMGAQGFRYEALLTPSPDIAKGITGNPAGAMTAQGNVRAEAVSNLLG